MAPRSLSCLGLCMTSCQRPGLETICWVEITSPDRERSVFVSSSSGCCRMGAGGVWGPLHHLPPHCCSVCAALLRAAAAIYALSALHFQPRNALPHADFSKHCMITVLHLHKSCELLCLDVLPLPSPLSWPCMKHCNKTDRQDKTAKVIFTFIKMNGVLLASELVLQAKQKAHL